MAENVQVKRPINCTARWNCVSPSFAVSPLVAVAPRYFRAILQPLLPRLLLEDPRYSA